MPFGLCNAPSCFQRLMERVLEGLQWRMALVYLDDIIVFGGSFDEKLERLEEVLRRLRAANLKLSPKKCLFFQSEVPFLRNIVGRDRVKTDPQKVAAVQDLPVPTCVADVKSFVGLCTYYRRFVKQFAQFASPLHQLTRKGARFEWSATCQVAFDSLKRALVEAPVLPYPDPASPYLLDTDASAVLSQTLKAPEGQLARWLGRLEQYHNEVQHRPGRVHHNADSLSRRPCEPECQHCLRREERGMPAAPSLGRP
ncbi:hypothetical protein C7M84_015906 [Penaeus vannamei]|uniref:RNA-directed DNA polymerase n=1 Tax=Penaeus vannamei TaxID=6689 RepID=A0A423SPL0_PENVA|nr:hypothetical protein C7M84_015906 [Penaeus vannamei]